MILKVNQDELDSIDIAFTWREWWLDFNQQKWCYLPAPIGMNWLDIAKFIGRMVQYICGLKPGGLTCFFSFHYYTMNKTGWF